MMRVTHQSLTEAINDALKDLVYNGEVVKTTSWQGNRVEDGDNKLSTFELLNYSFTAPVVDDLKSLREQIHPNLPWADDHFAERVCGKPLNPGVQYRNWPYYKDERGMRTEGKETAEPKFTHTYMERFWPKWANMSPESLGFSPTHSGIRYPYGDLSDVVHHLLQDPYTRQAYFPIWFPEDTGVVHGGRVPCTLGYHFLLRNNQLHIFYGIRSCDLLRHFQDDVYLACRLLLWVLAELKIRDREGWTGIESGNLTMHIYSLHVFTPERKLLEYKYRKGGLVLE